MNEMIFDLYTLTSILSIAIIAIFGFCLLVSATPPEPEFHNYRISRRLLAVAYIVLAAIRTSELLLLTDSDKITKLTFVIIISIAMLQAFLFTFALIVLINIRFFKRKRIVSHLIPLLILLTGLSVASFCENNKVFYILLVVTVIAYIMQLVYYVWLFGQEYRKYRLQMQNYFSGNEEKRMQWVFQLFYMALCIGILALLGVFFNILYYLFFMVAYTLFYVYFVVKYINYATVFRSLLPAIKLTEQQIQVSPTAKPSYGCNNEELEKAINEWIEEKKFVSQNITLEKLATELNTNHTYLSEFINKKKQQTFKLWINTLRIEEAQKLLVEDPVMPISLIIEKVGVASKATFFRQFTNITGMTPGMYREKMKNLQSTKTPVN